MWCTCNIKILLITLGKQRNNNYVHCFNRIENILELTLSSLCYLGMLYHLGGEGGGLSPVVFSRSTSPIHFKLCKYLKHHNYFESKSKWYPRSRDFFNDIIIFREILGNFDEISIWNNVWCKEIFLTIASISQRKIIGNKQQITVVS